MIPIFYRPEMVAHAESYSPSAAKPKIVIDHWLAKGRIQPEQLRSFEPADIEDFTLAHDEHFVRAVLSLEEDNGFGNRSQAVADSLLYTTGSMIAAMQHVLEHGGFACSPTSGFHHAGRNYASGFCTFNGLAVAAIPKVSLYREKKGRIRSLTPAEFAKLLQHLPPHLADMATFSVATGLRQGNVRGLTWSQINLELRHAWITPEQHKNGRAHAVPLNDMAMAVLQKQIGKHPTHVFSYRGHPIANVSTKAWWKGLELAGIENFRWHDLRHTFVTWHRQAGTPTHELQRLGGWKTLSMVERYAHVAPEGLQAAASRLDNVLGYALATPDEKRD